MYVNVIILEQNSFLNITIFANTFSDALLNDMKTVSRKLKNIRGGTLLINDTPKKSKFMGR